MTRLVSAALTLGMVTIGCSAARGSTTRDTAQAPPRAPAEESRQAPVRLSGFPRVLLASATRVEAEPVPLVVSGSPVAEKPASASVPALPPPNTQIVVYSFEGSLEGWQIPDWAKASADYVGSAAAVSQAQANDGAASLQVDADFPGDRWTGVYVEREVEVTDWTPFSQLAVDLLVPAGAPEGLTGRIILTTGEQWVWTEMNRALPLAPGRWTPIAVSLKPGSFDWKFFPDDEFRRRVRKIGVRIESDRGGPAYRGPLYLDHIRLSE